jgi:heptosyltransferase-2
MFKTLVIAPSWVGDAVMVQPLLKRLKERRPDAEINLFAPAWVAPVFERMAEVNRVEINPLAHGEFNLKLRWRLGQALQKDGYRQAIVLPNSWKSALMPFFARIPLRTGFVGEFRYGLLNDARPLDKKALPLMVERFAQLAEAPDALLPRPLPYPRLAASEADRDKALGKFGLAPRKPVAAFCVGAEYGPAKRWPAGHFAELAQRMADRYEVWLFGSGKDAAIGSTIEQCSGGLARNLCGKTDLAEAIDLLSLAQLVVSNDSGLMHAAAALDKPLVAIFGSSSASFTPPLSDKARIASLKLPCSPCFKRECPHGHLDCLVKLGPRQVEAEIEQLIKDFPL